jgi:hypothetical protein
MFPAFFSASDAFQVEPAKSDRSKCNKKTKKDPCVHGGKISKGHVRIGSWNEDVGGYSWYVHLECWRVPAKVWLAFGASTDSERIRSAMHLMDSVSICGFSSMSCEQQDIFIQHVSNPSNWARAPSDLARSGAKSLEDIPDQTQVDEKKKVKSVKAKAAKMEREVPDASSSSLAQAVHVKHEDGPGAAVIAPFVSSPDSALTIRASASQKRSFIMPIPGKDGALPGAMGGLNVVLTGL